MKRGSPAGKRTPERRAPERLAAWARVAEFGPRTAAPALDAALLSAYQALVKANGGSKNVSAWTQDANTVATGLAMPAYDAIGFRSLGIVGQPSIPWQNRPTFQQVVSFPAHRPA